MCKYLIIRFKEYIFIILTATIFSITFFSKSFSKENPFKVSDNYFDSLYSKLDIKILEKLYNNYKIQYNKSN